MSSINILKQNQVFYFRITLSLFYETLQLRQFLLQFGSVAFFILTTRQIGCDMNFFQANFWHTTTNLTVAHNESFINLLSVFDEIDN